MKRVTRQILQGLVYTHDSGVIHGDVKAANILFDGSNCKLSDFGESLNFEQTANG